MERRMMYLVWAWRVWFGQISIDTVPEPIRPTVEKITESLKKQKPEGVNLSGFAMPTRKEGRERVKHSRD